MSADKRNPRIEIVTPERAAQLLDHNKENRPLSQQHVNRIASQIVTGKWQFNGDTIKISEDGDVLDGQHRLWAIMEAKMPVETVIIFGIKREAFATIDTISKARGGADILALNGVTRHRKTLSGALAWLIRWNRKCLEDYKAPQFRVENSDIEMAYRENPGILRAADRAAPLRLIANPSILAFLFYIFTNRNCEIAERMMTTLENPAGVGVNDPFFRLRAYFLADREKRDPIVTIALAIKAVNAAARGEKMQVLRWQNQGKSPEDFPKLDIGIVSRKVA